MISIYMYVQSRKGMMMKNLHKTTALAVSSLLYVSAVCANTMMYESTALAQLLKEEMRRPEYAQEILPNNFTHVIQLLDYGTKTDQPRAYAQLVLRRMTNVLKSAHYVNAHAAQQLIAQLATALEPYIVSHRYRAFLGGKAVADFDMLERFNTCVTYHLYKKFSTEYESFKNDPGNFLDALSVDIMHIAQEETSIEQLRQTTYRFLEVMLSKMIWSPEEGQATWRTVKIIADQLAGLMEVNAIDNLEDLDDLYRTLVYRFCYFIDLTAPSLDAEFYQIVREDLKNGSLLFLETEDEDPCIETKAEVLHRTILTGQAKRHAYIKQTSR